MDRIQAGRKYQGKILPDIDINNRGRYLVNIPELQPHTNSIEGIWCRNRVHNWKYNTDYISGSYGCYYPLQGNTRVLVEFLDADLEQGEIVKIIADQESMALPFFSSPEDRDHLFTLIRTPLYGNIFHINEKTKEKPNSVHFYFNSEIGNAESVEIFGGNKDQETSSGSNIRTKYIINEDGVHFYTADNIAITIENDGHIAINGKVLLKVGGNSDIHIKGDSKLYINGQSDIYANGVINIKSDSEINIQGSSINLNGGTTAAISSDSKGYNFFNPSDKELSGISRSKDIGLAVSKMGE